jgi:hypothetical protein
MLGRFGSAGRRWWWWAPLGLSLGAAALAPSTSGAALAPSAPSSPRPARAQELTTVNVRRNHGFKLSLDATNGPGGSFSSLALTLERRSGGHGAGSALQTTIYRFNRRISFKGSANLASAQLHGLLLRRRGWIDMTFRATRRAQGLPVPKGCVGSPGEKRRGILRGSLTLHADSLGLVRLREAKATLSIPPEISDCNSARGASSQGTALEMNYARKGHGVYVYATKPAPGGLVEEGVVISQTRSSCSFSYSYTALARRSDYTFPADLLSALLKGAAGIHGRATYKGTRGGGRTSDGVLTGDLSVSFATLGTVRPLAGRKLRGAQFRY